MRISEILVSMANELESGDNEALLLAEYDQACLQVVAEHCVLAAAILKQAAVEVEAIEPGAESMLTAENLENLGRLAQTLDESGDIELSKQASVLDEILLTIGSNAEILKMKRAEKDARLETIRLKYKHPKEVLDKINQASEANRAIEKSEMANTEEGYRTLEHSLSTRICPDHAGVQVMISPGEESTFICPLDHRKYDFKNGFTLLNGKHVSGGDVANQSNFNILNPNQTTLFDTRNGRLAGNVK